jgi:hypothetical protein
VTLKWSVLPKTYKSTEGKKERLTNLNFSKEEGGGSESHYKGNEEKIALNMSFKEGPVCSVYSSILS